MAKIVKIKVNKHSLDGVKYNDGGVVCLNQDQGILALILSGWNLQISKKLFDPKNFPLDSRDDPTLAIGWQFTSPDGTEYKNSYLFKDSIFNDEHKTVKALWATMKLGLVEVGFKHSKFPYDYLVTYHCDRCSFEVHDEPKTFEALVVNRQYPDKWLLVDEHIQLCPTCTGHYQNRVHETDKWLKRKTTGIPIEWFKEIK